MFIRLLHLIPKKLLSFIVGQLAGLERPRVVVRLAIKWFVSGFKIQLDESRKEFEEFQSVRDVFTRELRRGVRPLGEGLLSPVDGALNECGKIVDGRLIQAKEKMYSLVEFVGDASLAERLDGGSFFTFYLAPPDYHRVHFPIDAAITSVRLIPGTLFPVNSTGVLGVDNLFGRNERLVLRFQSTLGEGVLAMVGALNVGSMELAIDPAIRTNASLLEALGFAKERVWSYDPPLAVGRGEECGTFRLGSSVVLLFEQATSLQGVKLGACKMGETIVGL